MTIIVLLDMTTATHNQAQMTRLTMVVTVTTLMLTQLQCVDSRFAYATDYNELLAFFVHVVTMCRI